MRDVLLENGIDPDSLRNGNNSNPGSSALSGTSISPPRDLLAENSIDPEELKKSNWTPTAPFRDIIGGLATAGQNIHNFLTPQSMNTNYDFNAPGSIGLGIDHPDVGDQVVQGISRYAPAMALPGGEAEQGATWASKIASKYLPSIASQGVYGASQDPDNRMSGAVVGGAGGALGEGIEDAYNALRPSNLFRGKLTPEQLQQNLDVTRGTNTPLGRVIQSPSLNRLQENVLPHVLFSGSENTTQQAANQVAQKGNDVMSQLGEGISPGNFGAQLQDALKTASSQARKDKNAMYGKVNDLADSSNLTVGRDNLQQSAKSRLDEINQSPELADHVDPTLTSALKKYANSNEGNSLKLSNIFKGKLGDMANKFYQNGQMYEYGIANELKNSLGSDINSSIDNSSNQELKNAYQESQDNYAKNFAPFEDRDIVKFTRQGGDSDLVMNHFLKTGNNDRANLLAKLQNAISPRETQGAGIPQMEQPGLPGLSSPHDLSQGKTRQYNTLGNQGSPSSAVSDILSRQQGKNYSPSASGQQSNSNLLAYSYLSRSLDENGQINPLKFATLYNKLGENQKNILIKDPQTRKMLDNYSDLAGKNSEAFNLMFNPKTGARNTGGLYDFLQLIGGLTGHHYGGLMGGAAAQVGISGAGRLANHYLTSPSFRESLINAMIKNKTQKLPNVAKKGIGAASSLSNPDISWENYPSGSS